MWRLAALLVAVGLELMILEVLCDSITLQNNVLKNVQHLSSSNAESTLYGLQLYVWQCALL